MSWTSLTQAQRNQAIINAGVALLGTNWLQLQGLGTTRRAECIQRSWRSSAKYSLDAVRSERLHVEF